MKSKDIDEVMDVALFIMNVVSVLKESTKTLGPEEVRATEEMIEHLKETVSLLLYLFDVPIETAQSKVDEMFESRRRARSFSTQPK